MIHDATFLAHSAVRAYSTHPRLRSYMQGSQQFPSGLHGEDVSPQTDRIWHEVADHISATAVFGHSAWSMSTRTNLAHVHQSGILEHCSFIGEPASVQEDFPGAENDAKCARRRPAHRHFRAAAFDANLHLPGR